MPRTPGRAFSVLVPGGLTTTSHVVATIQVNAGTVAVRPEVDEPGVGFDRPLALR